MVKRLAGYEPVLSMHKPLHILVEGVRRIGIYEILPIGERG